MSSSITRINVFFATQTAIRYSSFLVEGRPTLHFKPVLVGNVGSGPPEGARFPVCSHPQVSVSYVLLQLNVCGVCHLHETISATPTLY